jgi:hypothetical protein
MSVKPITSIGNKEVQVRKTPVVQNQEESMGIWGSGGLQGFLYHATCIALWRQNKSYSLRR